MRINQLRDDATCLRIGLRVAVEEWDNEDDHAGKAAQEARG